jgi:mannose-1-phosphate guanylyltransferase
MLGLDVRSNRIALLLAGGDGRRLQDLTRSITGSPIPKQYCRLWKGCSLLETTISRALLFAPYDRIHVVMNANHLDLAADQVRTLQESNIIVQPLNRDTGPGVVYALLHMQQIYSDAVVAVLPTDHYVDKDWAFVIHLFRAIETISRLPDKIAILGITPDRPETGYGYILPAQPLKITDGVNSGRSYHVEAFTEKPDPACAQAIIDRGGLWNTLVMVFRLSRMLELIKELHPDKFERIAHVRAAPSRAAELYQDLPPWNFSMDVLACIPQHIVVLRVDNVAWSDWGTRESIERTYKALKTRPSWNPQVPIEKQLLG